MSTSTGVPALARISPAGQVTNISTSGVLNQAETGSYGAAWVYGNGNLAFSYNSTGQITQIKVADATGATPTASRVSQISGPTTRLERRRGHAVRRQRPRRRGQHPARRRRARRRRHLPGPRVDLRPGWLVRRHVQASRCPAA
ncbi:hypothetical protein GCM10025868_36300 [Angustibacter aerolatus]|uniref:DUF6923 domain-containing protein n=1 Tax=Angustibacter aerolatus TaxID=1162965 RepID=A0ABQ6JJF5_9ACTN|nr:hypothetical protein [Angustibacter aerolatus]GMA88380.1 hypothetical protein GCM10025868_36300 [Angustibacter aerolatus]